MMRGNKPAKYAAVTEITDKQLNKKPHFVFRVRAAPQEMRKDTIANAKQTIANTELNKSVYT